MLGTRKNGQAWRKRLGRVGEPRMKKQALSRVAAALALSAVVAGGLALVGNRAEEPSLTYNELLVLAGDQSAASAALNELEAGSGLASSSVSKVEEALARIFAAEYGMGTPDSDEETPAESDSAASDSVTEEEAASDLEAVIEEISASASSADSSSASSAASASHPAESAAHSHAASSAAPSEAASRTPTADEICDEKLAGYIRQIEQLQSRSEKQLYRIMLSAYDEYMSKPESERGLVTKVSVVLSKSGELNKAQNECDAEFARIIKEMRQTLREYGRDETLADEAEKTYKQKKNAMIKELTDQAYSGGDGSGQSGKWLKEHAAELNN